MPTKASRDAVIQDLRALKETEWDMIVPDGVEDKLILDRMIGDDMNLLYVFHC